MKTSPESQIANDAMIGWLQSGPICGERTYDCLKLARDAWQYAVTADHTMPGHSRVEHAYLRLADSLKKYIRKNSDIVESIGPGAAAKPESLNICLARALYSCADWHSIAEKYLTSAQAHPHWPKFGWKK